MAVFPSVPSLVWRDWFATKRALRREILYERTPDVGIGGKHDAHREAQPHRPVGLRHPAGAAPLPPVARGRRGGARPGRAGLGARVHAPRHRPLPGDDLRGHRARHAPLRRLRRRGGEGQGGLQPGEEGGGRHQRLRDERGALAPDAHAAREPRHHGLPRRGADAQGGRDAGDGREPAARLRPRLRPARGGAHRGPPGAPAAQRAGAHLRALPRLAAGARHHDLGRRRRHAREHLALRRGEGDRARWRSSTSSTRRSSCRARTSRTWAA